jgi:prepilin-type N-terminal cleavage/methylation domain-containing protein
MAGRGGVMKKGFTLIELLVVIGMIAILTAAASSSVMKAKERSMISRATTEVREMTTAILAYENYDARKPLKEYATANSWKKATEGELEFILGAVTDKQGRPIPVLFNASVSNSGEIRDPWGTPYEFMIAPAGDASDSEDKVGDGLGTYMYLPNLHRLTRQEMGLH